MLATARRILTLTLDLERAAADGDLERCTALLAERGESVGEFARLHAAAGGAAPSPDVREILERVRRLDADLERTWTELRDRAGHELDRIASRPKQKHGTEAPCILDRQA